MWWFSDRRHRRMMEHSTTASKSTQHNKTRRNFFARIGLIKRGKGENRLGQSGRKLSKVRADARIARPSHFLLLLGAQARQILDREATRGAFRDKKKKTQARLLHDIMHFAEGWRLPKRESEGLGMLSLDQKRALAGFSLLSSLLLRCWKKRGPIELAL